MYINVWDFFTVTYIQCGNCTTLLKTSALLFECWKQELRLTIVFTMLLGHVSFPGLWRVVMHSQYLSMKGMISCKEILDTQYTKQLERTWTLFCLDTRGSAMSASNAPYPLKTLFLGVPLECVTARSGWPRLRGTFPSNLKMSKNYFWSMKHDANVSTKRWDIIHNVIRNVLMTHECHSLACFLRK